MALVNNFAMVKKFLNAKFDFMFISRFCHLKPFISLTWPFFLSYKIVLQICNYKYCKFVFEFIGGTQVGSVIILSFGSRSIFDLYRKKVYR